MVKNPQKGEKRDPWQSKAYVLLQDMLDENNVTYGQLVRKLEKIGVKTTERAITNRIYRGSFAFSFVIQCAMALGITSIPVTRGNE